MKRTIAELYEKFAAFHERHNDKELDEFLMSLVGHLERADAMYHHFGYLLMHIRGTVAHQVRPPHLKEAIQRAERFLKNYEAAEAAADKAEGEV
jgi:hypothetical protein